MSKAKRGWERMLSATQWSRHSQRSGGHRDAINRGRDKSGPYGEQPQERVFTASEVAEFEYCSLAWWHDQFESLAHVDTEELFAHMVELEHDHGSEAPALPEYKMVEQLLLRRGAFDEGKEQHLEHAEELEELEEEAQRVPTTTGRMRMLVVILVVIVLIALVLIGAAFLVR